MIIHEIVNIPGCVACCCAGSQTDFVLIRCMVHQLRQPHKSPKSSKKRCCQVRPHRLSTSFNLQVRNKWFQHVPTTRVTILNNPFLPESQLCGLFSRESKVAALQKRVKELEVRITISITWCLFHQRPQNQLGVSEH